LSNSKLEEAQKLTPEEKEAITEGTERGLGTHITRQQISRRGFVKAMALMGAAATTLVLPTGTPSLNEVTKLP